jgi:UDP-3-O-[3-hydroxymyristoyl] glucosamine N-acyltransferase
VTWDGVIRLRGEALEALARRHGGHVTVGGAEVPGALAPIERAKRGDLAPLLSSRFAPAAREAALRGASLLVVAKLAPAVPQASAVWVHDHAAWALAELLERAVVPATPARVGAGSSIAPSAILGPRVVVGARVTIGPGAVIGYPGFGWATGANAAVRPIPQLGGVVIEDDVSIGPLTTVDAGTLSATRIRRGAKLDAHVHVGHNVDIGERTIVAAQCGFAGSVRVGADVLVGGQAGIADHVVVGDGAKIAAKSGVIGDVPARAVVAGYPAVPRMRWLRALAKLYGGIKDER